MEPLTDPSFLQHCRASGNAPLPEIRTASRKRRQSLPLPESESEPVRKRARIREGKRAAVRSTTTDDEPPWGSQPHRRQNSSPATTKVLPDSNPSQESALPIQRGPETKLHRLVDIDASPIQPAKRRTIGNESPPATDGTRLSRVFEPAEVILHWVINDAWPPEYTDPDFKMGTPLTKKRSSSDPSLNLSIGTSTTPDLPRELKTAPYRNARYEMILAQAGAPMDSPRLEPSQAARNLCQQLLEKDQPIPANSLFSDEVFKTACSKIRNENEARVIQDIARLIVASAETLATQGAVELEILIEKVNASWLKCFPLTHPRPQPDYSVGFRHSAFTKDQLDKLSPYVGKHNQMCSVMAREDMFFPFLTSEIKCGAEALNIADRQNMHSASVAVKGIVELFRRAGRQKELHHQILAFSISHDNEAVRIYGYYPSVPEGAESSYHRYPIHKFDITAIEGKEKWTAYKFTRSVYEIFVPLHLARLCSVIEELPGLELPSVPAGVSFPSLPGSDADQGGSVPSDLPGSASGGQPVLSSQTSEPPFKKPALPGPR